MLTLDKLAVYRKFDGDIDGWTRAPHDRPGSGMADDDWYLIAELLQGLALVASGRTSRSFIAQLELRLHAVTADEATRQALRALL